MPVTSHAGNEQPLDLTASMVGFTPLDEETGLSIYDFIFRAIRQSDTLDGSLFLKRFLEGPQAVWELQNQKLLDVPKLWSVTQCPDDVLPFLAWMAGWTSELRAITERITPLQFRRLLDASPTIWNERSTEDAWREVVTLLTGARSTSWTWFDERFIVESTAMTEERSGYDSMLVSDTDVFTSNVRVVDDGTGTMDRQLVLDVLGLLRPMGERILVSWIEFLDDFREDERTQWVDGVGDPMTVVDGEALLANAAQVQSSYVTAPLSASWGDYDVFSRVKGEGVFGVSLRAAGDDNRYKVKLDVAANRVRLSKVVGGIETVLVSVAPAIGILTPDTFYGVRVECAGTNIQVFVDGDLTISTTDATFAAGTVGIWHDSGGSATLTLIEVSPVPMDTNLIDVGARA